MRPLTGRLVVKEVRVVSELASAPLTRGRAAACKLLLAASIVLCPYFAHPLAAQTIRGEATAAVENGFARLVFTFNDVVELQVKSENGILVITFQRPVYVAVDKLAQAAAGYVSVARRDPDGKGIRMALTRKVKVNSLAVAERLFVDLLPESWSGLPPGLPRDVIEELARRAREADKKSRQQQAMARQSKLKSIRVRVATQPTFTRYIFDLPDLTGVAAHNEKDKLSLTFDAVIKFDLADVKATLPEVISSIDSETEQDTATVHFNFAGRVDVRTFREDSSFIVDVTPMDARAPRSEASAKSDEVAAAAADLATRMKAPPLEATSAPPPTRPPGAAEAEPRAPAAGTPAGTEAPARPAASEGKDDAARPRAQGAGGGAQPPPAPEGRVQVAPAAKPPAVAQPAPAVDLPRPAVKETIAPPSIVGDPALTAGSERSGQVEVATRRNGENLTLLFPFQRATPAAIFARAEIVWLVFDTESPVSLGRTRERNGTRYQ